MDSNNTTIILNKIEETMKKYSEMDDYSKGYILGYMEKTLEVSEPEQNKSA